MRKLFLLICLFSLLNLAAFAQSGNYMNGVNYLAEVSDTSMLLIDVVVSNYNNTPISAVGIDRIERVFHYSSSDLYGETLYMVAMSHEISAVNYSEYYIFDSFQNLIRYVYVADSVELIYKIDGKTVSSVFEKNRKVFTDNYFISEPELYFTYDKISERCAKELLYCSAVTGIPVYELEILKIREIYKSANSDKTLRVVGEKNTISYYKGKELVKLVISSLRNYEYYFDNTKLVFVFVSEGEGIAQQRLYFSNSILFKYLIGKDEISRDNYLFWDNSDEIIELYNEYLESK